MAKMQQMTPGRLKRHPGDIQTDTYIGLLCDQLVYLVQLCFVSALFVVIRKIYIKSKNGM